MKLNKKVIVRTALCAVLVSALGYSFVAKSETKLIPFQGKLTDASGQVISDGAIVVQFKMYDAPVGGQAKWNGEVQMLSVNGGLVNTTLGTKASLKNVDFSSPTYLEITIDANGDKQIGPEDPPLLPRQSIIPAVYAVQAGDAKTLSGYDWSSIFGKNDPKLPIPIDKIADESLTEIKIAKGAITSSRIANGAVNSVQIANGAVTSTQIANEAVTSSQLAKDSVTTDKIATNSITVDKLDLSEVELKKLVGVMKTYMSKPVEEFDWTVHLGTGTCIEMIWCEPGEFTMGSPTSEKGHENDEIQHKVKLTKGFWLGKYEVTQGQYETSTKNPRGIGGNYPVSMVSYNDALSFCQRLTEKERAEGRLSNGYKYTLPTEAQWEYACRAGTTTALCNGDATTANMDLVGWYGNDNGGGGNAGGVSHPVGLKKPNAWGFYDMHGNVYEWCLDWYGTYPNMEVTDPTGPSTGSKRISRGSSWWDTPTRCRSAQRYGHAPSDYREFVEDGFRVALVPVQ